MRGPVSSGAGVQMGLPYSADREPHQNFADREPTKSFGGVRDPQSTETIIAPAFTFEH